MRSLWETSKPFAEIPNLYRLPQLISYGFVTETVTVSATCMLSGLGLCIYTNGLYCNKNKKKYHIVGTVLMDNIRTGKIFGRKIAETETNRYRVQHIAGNCPGLVSAFLSNVAE